MNTKLVKVHCGTVLRRSASAMSPYRSLICRSQQPDVGLLLGHCGHTRYMGRTSAMRRYRPSGKRPPPLYF